VTELWERDAWELADDIRSGRLSAVETLETFLERLDRFDASLNAICFRDDATARRHAGEIDAAVADGDDPGVFGGVPMGVKELAQVEGWPDTNASVPHEHDVATFDCAEVARLRAAGSVFVGLTTAPERGAVSFTASKLHGVTRNPWDLDRTPGGSSGGSAALVAACALPACTGSDGGGSIRIPSSYSGLFGMKTTLGLAGTGPEPYPFALQSVHGPIVRSVRDAARYVDVVAGPTLTDIVSLPAPTESFEELVASESWRDRLSGKRAAWSSTLGFASAETEVEKVTHQAAVDLVAQASLELVDVDVDFPKPGISWGMLGVLQEAAWDYDEVIDRLDDLDDVYRAGIELVTHLRPEGLTKAIRRRHEMLVASARVFEQVDLLLTPTTPTVAFSAEGTLQGEVNGARVSLMGLSAAFTAPFNMTGQPACSIPAGMVDGLPVGLQVVARRHDDALCFAAGALMERVRPWPKYAPYAASR
jgi:aspartyl-tRNA(Asn)/glutamyl-tRNA(Gln) amidotransferase subunit A